MKHDGHIKGGYPANADNITSERCLMTNFIDSLFLDQKRFVSDDTFLRLLLGAILLSYEDCKKVIETEPSEIFKGKNLSNHQFIMKVEKTKENLGVTEKIWQSWIGEVTSRYVSQNIFGFTNAQLEKFGCTANNNFVQTVHIDSRSIFETISDLGNSVNSNSHNMVELGNKVNSLTE